MRYFVLLTETAACVCYDTQAGPVVDTECGSEAVAVAVAQRMNAQQAAMQQARQHLANLRAAAAVLGTGQRRGVRYFEPDQFA